jgi:hypothetical protein
MHERVRCHHCHQWTDALLVWAAGDCCPSCNAPMTGLERSAAQPHDEPGSIRPSARFTSSGRKRFTAPERSDGPLSMRGKSS